MLPAGWQLRAAGCWRTVDVHAPFPLQLSPSRVVVGRRHHLRPQLQQKHLECFSDFSWAAPLVLVVRLAALPLVCHTLHISSNVDGKAASVPAASRPPADGMTGGNGALRERLRGDGGQRGSMERRGGKLLCHPVAHHPVREVRLPQPFLSDAILGHGVAQRQGGSLDPPDVGRGWLLAAHSCGRLGPLIAAAAADATAGGGWVVLGAGPGALSG